MADLAALLDREASAEIEAITSEAQQRAAEIVSAAEAEAQALLAQRERAARSAHEAAMVRARSSAQLDASSLTLQAQQAAIESIFDEVHERLASLAADPKRFKSVLTTLFREAVAAIGGAGAVGAVVVNEAHRELAGDIASSLGIEAEVKGSRTVEAGVRLEGGRNVAIENTLFGRLEALRDDLAADVARVLMGPDSGTGS